MVQGSGEGQLLRPQAVPGRAQQGWLLLLGAQEVIVVPNLAADAQLGMDVLGKMRLEQRDGVMRLSLH